MVFLWILLTSLWIKVSAQGPVLTMTSGEECLGSRVDLLCTHPDPLADPDNYLQLPITWAEDGTVIDFSDPANARFSPTRVSSTASMLSFDVTEEDHRDRVILYTCFLVRSNANRDRDESEALVLDPPEKPKAPIITSLPSISSNLTKWTHDNSCYINHTFMFNLTWTKMVDPPDPPSSGSNMTTATQYDFSRLPRGEYSVSIRAQCNEDPSILSDVTSDRINLTAPVSSPGTNTPSPLGTTTDNTVIVAVVISMILLIVIIILIGVGLTCVCVYSKKRKTSPSSSQETDEMSEDPPKSNLYGRVTYAELEHAEHRPVAAPSQGNVEYTQAVQVGKPPPPAVPLVYKGGSSQRRQADPLLESMKETEAKQVIQYPPPTVTTPYRGSSEKDDKELEVGGQDSNKSDEFHAQVVTIFQKVQIIRAPMTSGQDFLGNYKMTSFVANLVYVEDESQDVSDNDVERVAIAKSRHRTDKGLLVSNTGSIPGSLMENLEKNGCHFIGLHTSDRKGVTEDLVMKKLDLFFT